MRVKILWSGFALVAAASNVFAANQTAKLFDSAWSGMGFVLGYGDRDAYVTYACNGTDPGKGKECDGPPEVGMVRRFANIANDVVDALKDTYATCSALPTEGSEKVTVSDSKVTVTFAKPTLAIPTDWTGGGENYDRRMEFNATVANTTVKVILEASCKYEKTIMAGMNMEVGDQAPDYERQINVWMGSKDGLTVADAYVAEVKDTHVRGAYGFALQIDETKKQYKIWGTSGVHYDDADQNQSADVYNLTGNFADHSLSLRVKRFVAAGKQESSGNVSYMDQASLEAIDGSDVATLPKTSNYNLLADKSDVALNGSYSAQGCMDFDKPTTAPTSADACDELDWSSATTPVVDADGNFGPAWVFGTMYKKLKNIPTL